MLCQNLLNSGFKVRFRPHPETIKRSQNLMESYKEKFKHKNFLFDDNSENFILLCSKLFFQ